MENAATSGRAAAIRDDARSVAWWVLVGAAAGPTMRAAYAVVMFGLVAGIIGLVRGGRR